MIHIPSRVAALAVATLKSRAAGRVCLYLATGRKPYSTPKHGGM